MLTDVDSVDIELCVIDDLRVVVPKLGLVGGLACDQGAHLPSQRTHTICADQTDARVVGSS